MTVSDDLAAIEAGGVLSESELHRLRVVAGGVDALWSQALEALRPFLPEWQAALDSPSSAAESKIEHGSRARRMNDGLFRLNVCLAFKAWLHELAGEAAAPTHVTWSLLEAFRLACLAISVGDASDRRRKNARNAARGGRAPSLTPGQLAELRSKAQDLFKRSQGARSRVGIASELLSDIGVAMEPESLVRKLNLPSRSRRKAGTSRSG